MSTETPPSKLRLLTGLMLLGTFAAGAVTGAGLFASFGPRRPPPPLGVGPGARREPPFLRELDLTPEQRTKADAIFEKHRQALEQLFEENAPRVKAVTDQVDAELLTILTDAQRAKFEELKSHRPPRGPRGPPPDREPPPAPGEGPPPRGEPPPPPPPH
jgi:Spy/CpxP family protein refolding chaperone